MSHCVMSRSSAAARAERERGGPVVVDGGSRIGTNPGLGIAPRQIDHDVGGQVPAWDARCARFAVARRERPAAEEPPCRLSCSKTSPCAFSPIRSARHDPKDHRAAERAGNWSRQSVRCRRRGCRRARWRTLSGVGEQRQSSLNPATLPGRRLDHEVDVRGIDSQLEVGRGSQELR